MKKILICALCALCGWTSAAASDTLTVRIEGMHCAHCAHKVRTLLKKDAGISAVTVNHERRTATIAYNPAMISTDTIYGRLEATKRYKAQPYSKSDVISRELNLRIDDMHCKKCSDRITGRVSTMEGVDSLKPHLDKHYMSIHYDANKNSRDSIRTVITRMGYTPVSYYDSEKVGYAYFVIPAEVATQETIDNIQAMDAVNDANVNARRGALAVTYLCEKTSPEQLLVDIQKAGIKATVPAPHECKEEDK